MNQELAVYGSWLAATVGKVKLIGNSREFDLEKIFVELTIFEEYRRPTDKDALWSSMDAELRKKHNLFPRDGDKRTLPSRGKKPSFEDQKARRVIQPDQLIKPGTRALIVGAPGCGKTTLMRWLAWMTHNHGQHLPVFLELKTVARALSENQLLGEFLVENITGRCFQTQSPKKFKQYFSEQLRIGNVTILLDGLDEISDQKNLLQEAIRDFLASLPRNLSLIVSTRPYALTSGFADLEQMEIGPLTDRQMSNLLKHYYQDKPDVIAGLEKEFKQQTELRDLARVPFLLGVTAWLYQEHGIASSEPLKLYDQLVKQLAAKLDKEKGIQRFQFPDNKDHDTKREFLAFLASERLLDRTRQDKDDWLVFSEDEIKETAARFCRMSNAMSADSISLAEDIIHTTLLREVGLERYTFIHLTIHEYLGAKALARDKKAFCRAFFNPTLAEMEVLPMALGMTSDPDSFYEALEQLPESLDFKNLRIRARGMRYAGPKLGETRINQLVDRMMEFVGELKGEEIPYKNLVLQSFSRLSEQQKQLFSQELLIMLREEYWWKRVQAIRALMQIEERGQSVIQILVERLQDWDSNVRELAVEALGQLGAENEVMMRAIVERLRDEDWRVVAMVGKVLVQIGEVKEVRTTELVKLLGDNNWVVRARTAEVFGQIKVGNEKVVTELVKQLRKEKEWGAQVKIAEALGKIGVRNESVVSVLLEQLKNWNSNVRESAAEALGNIEVKSEIEVQSLRELLKDEKSEVRVKAVGALVQSGMKSETEITALLGLLKDGSFWVREKAGAVLGQVGVENETLMRTLVNLLEDKDWKVKESAVRGLGQIGVAKEVVIKALVCLLLDRDYSVRKIAVTVLGQIGAKSDEVITALVKRLGDEDEEVQLSAIRALGQFKEGGQVAVTPLLNLLGNKDPIIRENTIRVLGQLGIGSELVLKALVKQLRDKDFRVRASTSKVLVQLGFGSEIVVRRLVSLIQDKHLEVQSSAAESLNKIAPNDLSVAMKQTISISKLPFIELKIVETVCYYTNDPKLLNKLKWLKWLAFFTFRFWLFKTAADSAERYQRKLDLFRNEG